MTTVNLEKFSVTENVGELIAMIKENAKVFDHRNAQGRKIRIAQIRNTIRQGDIYLVPCEKVDVSKFIDITNGHKMFVRSVSKLNLVPDGKFNSDTHSLNVVDGVRVYLPKDYNTNANAFELFEGPTIEVGDANAIISHSEKEDGHDHVCLLPGTTYRTYYQADLITQQRVRD